MPLTGPLAVAVPGAPAALATLQRPVRTRSLADLWAPAVRAARTGVPCTAKTRRDVSEYAVELAADSGAAGVFLPDGDLPPVGARLPQPDLAHQIELLAGDPLALLHR